MLGCCGLATGYGFVAVQSAIENWNLEIPWRMVQNGSKRTTHVISPTP
jgi:hypothetical protein